MFMSSSEADHIAETHGIHNLQYYTFGGDGNPGVTANCYNVLSSAGDA